MMPGKRLFSSFSGSSSVSFSGRRALVTALIAQVSATLGTLVIIQLTFSLTQHDLPLWSKLLIASGIASAVALSRYSTIGWVLFQAILPPLFVLTLMAELPFWVPLIVVAVVLLAFQNVFRDRVPLYLSNVETLTKLQGLVSPEDAIRCVDLGCGLGAVPRSLARYNSHPESRFVGVETAVGPYLMALVLARLTRDRRIVIRYQSLWQHRLADYNLVYAFLSPHPMTKLFKKVQAEMNKGLFVSNSFDVPNYPPNRKIDITSGRASALLIWDISTRKSD